MSALPVKTKRGSRLMPPTPKCFELREHTPLVCGAQDECEHSDTRVEILPPGSVHFGKEICRNCDRVLRFLPKPTNTERQQFNSYRIAKLAMAAGLNDWERGFIKSTASFKKLSPRQQAVLYRIYSERSARVR
jgi:hypothetical protein